MVRKQLELDGVPRKRVTLTEGDGAAEGRPVVELRSMRSYVEELIGELIGYTGWVSGESAPPPPVSGYWEVTDNLTGAQQARCWYDAETQTWTGPLWVNYTLGPFAFAADYAWRGLRAPHPDGYGDMAAPDLFVRKRTPEESAASRDSRLKDRAFRAIHEKQVNAIADLLEQDFTENDKGEVVDFFITYDDPAKGIRPLRHEDLKNPLMRAAFDSSYFTPDMILGDEPGWGPWGRVRPEVDCVVEFYFKDKDRFGGCWQARRDDRNSWHYFNYDDVVWRARLPKERRKLLETS